MLSKSDRKHREITGSGPCLSTGAECHSDTQGETIPLTNFIRGLWPNTPQDRWNMLLTFFTAILAYIAFQQFRSDAAYIVPGKIIFEENTGYTTVPIENAGRRASSPINSTRWDAFFDKQGNIEGVAERKTETLPPIAAGHTPILLDYQLPDWGSTRIRNVKDQVEFVRIGAVLKYKAPLIGSTTTWFCFELHPIKKAHDLTWTNCALSFLRKMDLSASGRTQ